MNTKVLACPGIPTTLNFKFNNTPEPVSDPAWNAEMTRCPAFAAFAVINMPALNVPVAS